jgi:hypothetical protein
VPESSNWLLASGFPTKTLFTILLSPISLHALSILIYETNHLSSLSLSLSWVAHISQQRAIRLWFNLGSFSIMVPVYPQFTVSSHLLQLL